MAYTEFAQIYDALIADRPYENWLAFIARRLPPGARKAADGACGTGTITMGLAGKLGLETVGFDLSAEMLGVAAQKLRRAGVRAVLARQDLTSFALNGPVDLFTVCCDGVNYLLRDEEAEACFSRVYASLRPGGVFLFDVSAPAKLRAMDGKMYGSDDEEIAYIWQNEVHGDLIDMSLSFFVRGDDGRYCRIDEEQTQRLYTIGQLTELLRKAGFTRISAYDDYTERPADETSLRVTFTAETEG